jgi:hypothetical protein
MDHTALSTDEARWLAVGLHSYPELHRLPVSGHFAVQPPVETGMRKDVSAQQKRLPAPDLGPPVPRIGYSGVVKKRTIRPETWKLWKEDIFDRYINQNQTLERIMEDYSTHKAFHGT